MYLHIGNDKVITHNEIVGIFDLDNTTVSKKTRDFLNKKEKNGEVITVGFELPKSFIVCRNGRVYLSPVSTQTLLKRIKKNAAPEV